MMVCYTISEAKQSNLIWSNVGDVAFNFTEFENLKK